MPTAQVSPHAPPGRLTASNRVTRKPERPLRRAGRSVSRHRRETGRRQRRYFLRRGGPAWLQSRGHFLTGGSREKHFDLFKRWATTTPTLAHLCWASVSSSTANGCTPSTRSSTTDCPTTSWSSTSWTPRPEAFCPRKAPCPAGGLPVASVPVSTDGPLPRPGRVDCLSSALRCTRVRPGVRASTPPPGARPRSRTDLEGDRSVRPDGRSVYQGGGGGRVVERYKFMRAGFLTTVLDSGSHWLRRPILPNQLGEGVDLFGGSP